jgi:hypothetical protein
MSAPRAAPRRTKIPNISVATDNHFDAVYHRREDIKVSQDNVFNKRALSAESSVIDHGEHPLPQTADWYGGSISVIRRQLPERLLPPHTPEQYSRHPHPYVLIGALPLINYQIPDRGNHTP